MPHSVTTRNLGRQASWRKATVRSLAQGVIRHERIETTWARAKEAQRLVERLITLGKGGTLFNRRLALKILPDPEAIGRLFSTVAPQCKQRPGGYTRILRLGHRSGDGARLALLELVDRGTPEKEKKPAGPKPAQPPPQVTTGTAVVEAPRPKPKEKPKRFLDGLRKFFKPKERPS